MLTVLSFILQAQNSEELQQQSTNDDIMHELREQDSKYLQSIVAQNEQIIKLIQNLIELVERSMK